MTFRRELEDQSAEEMVRSFCEAKGAKVYRPSWPDFIVIWPDGESFFVEVKSKHERIKKPWSDFRQKKTFQVLGQLFPNFRIMIICPHEKEEWRWNSETNLLEKNRNSFKDLRKHPRLRKIINSVLKRIGEEAEIKLWSEFQGLSLNLQSREYQNIESFLGYLRRGGTIPKPEKSKEWF